MLNAVNPAGGNDRMTVVRRTKILATLGPASSTPEVVSDLIRAGADAFRLNFSHGKHEDLAALVRIIRDAAIRSDRFVPIVGDIQGPKLRLGEVEGVIELPTGSKFTLTTRPQIGNARICSTPFLDLPREVKPGQRIFINDGLVELQVDSIDGNQVHTTVIHGGPISSKKGMNFPDTELAVPAITEKDREDLRFAVDQKVDYVAASFVRRKENIEELRSLLHSLGGPEILIIAKLEKAQAIDNLESILEASDGVMVARGDLGVELPPEAVPVVQKRILELARLRGRFAITATQMLESMKTSSRPTRAEASDVANAIFDGSDAVMLSAETAAGSYPVESVEMMSRIILSAEAHPELNVHYGRDPAHHSYETDEFTDAIAGAARYCAEEIDAKYVVVFTLTGFAARLMSKFRPRAEIIGMTRSSWVARRMNLLWGVIPMMLKDVGQFHEQVVTEVEKFLLQKNMVVKGDRIVIMMGSPIYERARTNLLRVHRVGGA